MEVSFILKIAGVGLIVAVINHFLSKTGREDHVGFVSLAGVLIVLFVLISKLGELINVIEGVFGIV